MEKEGEDAGGGEGGTLTWEGKGSPVPCVNHPGWMAARWGGSFSHSKRHHRRQRQTEGSLNSSNKKARHPLSYHKPDWNPTLYVMSCPPRQCKRIRLWSQHGNKSFPGKRVGVQLDAPPQTGLNSIMYRPSWSWRMEINKVVWCFIHSSPKNTSYIKKQQQPALTLETRFFIFPIASCL